MKGKLSNCIARYEYRKDKLKAIVERTPEQQLELELTRDFLRSLYRIKK